MTAFHKFNQRDWFLAQAQAAAWKAEASSDKSDKNLWLDLAASWKFLAGLQASDCYCGKPSIGYKLLPNSEKLAVCGAHLIELVAESIDCQTGDRKPQ